MRSESRIFVYEIQRMSPTADITHARYEAFIPRMEPFRVPARNFVINATRRCNLLRFKLLFSACKREPRSHGRFINPIFAENFCVCGRTDGACWALLN